MSELVPFVKDIVIAGAGRDYLVAGLWVNDDQVNADEFVRSEKHTLTVKEVIHQYNSRYATRGQVVRRVFVMKKAPRADLGELTDKGTINQTAYFRNREGFLDNLYKVETDKFIIEEDV